jgi:hypothetical protein
MPTRSYVRDLTRPVHVDNKLFQRAISRNITLTVSVVILVALAVALIGLPVKGLISQRGDITQRQQEFAALEDANEQLQTEIQRLQTPEGIRETERLPQTLQKVSRVAEVDPKIRAAESHFSVPQRRER